MIVSSSMYLVSMRRLHEERVGGETRNQLHKPAAIVPLLRQAISLRAYTSLTWLVNVETDGTSLGFVVRYMIRTANVSASPCYAIFPLV